MQLTLGIASFNLICNVMLVNSPN